MMKPDITIYTAALCPFCDNAKNLLTKKGAEYKEVRIDLDPVERKSIEQLTGRRSVPQIFIGDIHVGGFDDLSALEIEGELDSMLSDQ